jgi:hypothetical protein
MGSSVDRLSVKIAILGLISNLPEPPSVNIPSPSIESQPGRSLTFKHEISIAQQLAFICAYSDDPLHVLATCVEEASPSDGLTIHLAANSGMHGPLIDGLKKISQILQNEASNG